MRSPVPVVFARVVRVAAIIAVCGCSRYVELGNVAPKPGGDIRVTLSMRAFDVAYGPIGSAVRQLEGNMLSADDSAIVMSVTGVTRTTGFDEAWLGQQVTVARSNVTSIEAKKLSVPRTLGTIGAVLAGSFFAHGAISGGEGTSSGVRKPGGGN